jgi:carboxyl-terminal processing protease
MWIRLQRLYKENKAPLKGLVLDLRNDPGGVLSGAVGVSAAFLPKDALVVYTEGRTRDAKMRLTATREDYMRSASGDDLSTLPAAVKDLPVVVLINSGSASASEIVAGALQDHGRALVVGQRSFGKGSVQTILPLTNNTALKITTARYFTPNGRSIQAKGIEPDVVVEEALLNISENKDAFRTYEADLDGHLSNPTGADKPASAASAVTDSEKPKTLDKADAPRDIVSANDYQLKQALSALKVQQFLLRKAKK